MSKRNKPKECPKCGKKKIASFLFGLPDFLAIEKDLKAGRIVLGGCCLSSDDPEWKCQTCGHEWRTSPLRANK